MYEMLAFISLLMAVSVSGGSLTGIVLWEAIWTTVLVFSVNRMEEDEDD